MLPLALSNVNLKCCVSLASASLTRALGFNSQSLASAWRALESLRLPELALARPANLDLTAHGATATKVPVAALVPAGAASWVPSRGPPLPQRPGRRTFSPWGHIYAD